MKQIIKDVLNDMSNSNLGQLNLASTTTREMIANAIIAVIKTKRGWTLDLSKYNSEPKFDTLEYKKTEEQKARESWTCSICGESTYEVEYDYIGSGTNHLGCELKSQKEIDEYIEDIDEQAYAQGRGSSYDDIPEGLKRAKKLSRGAMKDGIRREKNWSQKNHGVKVFDDND
jgi:hypothetical protein